MRRPERVESESVSLPQRLDRALGERGGIWVEAVIGALTRLGWLFGTPTI